MKLRCIILDDEPLALRLLADYVKRTPFLELSGSYDNAIDALGMIHKGGVDLVLSDIQMPELSGLELARILKGMDGGNRPALIFTTAYDKYALQGYKVDAIDYLLKPFSYEDFLMAVSKVSRQIPEKTNVSVERKENFILFKVEYQLVKVFHDQILFIEGLKDYVKVHIEGEKRPLLSLSTMKGLEERLPAEKFARIHRSFIANLDKIRIIGKNSVTIGETELPVSESAREVIQSHFRMGME